jgi:hypothetical protein
MMTIRKALSLTVVAALLTGCAGSPLEGIQVGRSSVAGTWEGKYICAQNSGFKSIPSVARMTFEPVGPDVSSIAPLIGTLRNASQGDFDVKPFEAQKFTGTGHYTLTTYDNKTYGGTTQFDGFTDPSGAFHITQERFFDWFGGDYAKNLVAPKVSGAPNPDGTMTGRICGTTMVLRKVAD